MSTQGWITNGAARVGPWGIALIIMAPLTVALVAVTLFRTPTPPASAYPATASRPTSQSTSAPSVDTTAGPKVAGTTAGPQIVAFLGDSSAAGTGATRQSKSWVTLVSLNQGWVKKNLSLDSTSYSTAGQPGGTSYTARLDAVVATGANIVVISGGRNDVDVAAAQVRADVRATFAGIRLGLPNARIIVVSPIWGNSVAPARLIALASIVKAEAKLAGATYLDIGDPLSGHDNMVTFDGVHPNNAGHAAIAVAVEKALASP